MAAEQTNARPIAPQGQLDEVPQKRNSRNNSGKRGNKLPIHLTPKSWSHDTNIVSRDRHAYIYIYIYWVLPVTDYGYREGQKQVLFHKSE